MCWMLWRKEFQGLRGIKARAEDGSTRGVDFCHGVGGAILLWRTSKSHLGAVENLNTSGMPGLSYKSFLWLLFLYISRWKPVVGEGTF